MEDNIGGTVPQVGHEDFLSSKAARKSKSCPASLHVVQTLRGANRKSQYNIVDLVGKSGYFGHSFHYWSGNLVLVETAMQALLRKIGLGYTGYDLGGCWCVSF